jgi:hypothetical protein
MLVKYARDELAERNIGCLFKYVNIVKDYCLAVANPIGIYLLLEICSISSPKVARLLHENIDWFKVTLTITFKLNSRLINSHFEICFHHLESIVYG